SVSARQTQYAQILQPVRLRIVTKSRRRVGPAAIDRAVGTNGERVDHFHVFPGAPQIARDLRFGVPADQVRRTIRTEIEPTVSSPYRRPHLPADAARLVARRYGDETEGSISVRM